MRRAITIIFLLAGLTLLPACRSHPKPASQPATRLAAAPRPTTSPTTRPAILDIRKGTGSFPLADRSIDSAGALSASLRAGYLARLTPAGPDFITLTGVLPSLDLLRIDVSGARVNPKYRPHDFAKGTTTERSIAVRRLEYVADPLRYEAASTRIHLTADDATLEIIRDAKNGRGMVLHGARRGRFDFHVSLADVNKMFSIAPRFSSSPVTVVRSAVTFNSTDPHTLEADLDLRARWLLLPITMSLHGRITASSDGTLTFSDLSATGYDPGGLLAASFVNPGIKKINGTTQPFIAFPDPNTHPTDVTFNTEDGLRFTVDFGR